MPSPEIEKEPQKPPTSRTRRRIFPTLLALCILVPVVLTGIGRLTSPPTAPGPPVGHILYMEADEPSEHTSLLRGLRELGPDGTERELIHEIEPQDVDAGSRTWINQPCGSPDGKWVAYEVQNITLQEEKQGVDYQLWVLPLREPGKPHLLLDITQAKLKPFVGLTWTPDSRQIIFHNDDTVYLVNVQAGALTHFFQPTRRRKTAARMNGSVVHGHVIHLIRSHAAWPIGATDTFTVQWGWSVWGGRRITNIRYSPDGRYVAYSVSKRPFEDELFYVDTTTGKCRQLPVRTGSSAWDWTP